MTYPRIERTTSLRVPEKLSYDAATAHAVLDEAFVCHVGYVAGDGAPRVLPTFHVRIGETLYFHGSTGSRVMLSGRDVGVDVSVTVTLVDGIVYSRSWFHHSMNYRCVIVHGTARPVTDPEEKWTALGSIVDKLGPGRADGSRPPTAKELAQTAVLAVDLAEVSVKVRTGGPNEDPADLDLEHWAGVLPLSLAPGGLAAGDGVTVPVPPGLAAHVTAMQS